MACEMMTKGVVLILMKDDDCGDLTRIFAGFHHTEAQAVDIARHYMSQGPEYVNYQTVDAVQDDCGNVFVAVDAMQIPKI